MAEPKEWHMEYWRDRAVKAEGLAGNLLVENAALREALDWIESLAGEAEGQHNDFVHIGRKARFALRGKRRR